ncbi:MAG: hypothetical protein IT371_16165 [Deltaproteobacteria bacterium]|nr:hypothetical protein [Deltaproteobacteria bacterium]
MSKRRRRKKVWERETWEKNDVSSTPAAEAKTKGKGSGCGPLILGAIILTLIFVGMCRSKEKERVRKRRVAELQRQLDETRRRIRARPTPVRALPPPIPRRPVLPEKGPHPDYPTPRAAGTEQLFLAEEPDRGPRPTSVALPSKKGLRASVHAHCDLDHATFVCSRGTVRPANARHWRLYRKGAQLLLAEKVWPGGRALASYVFEWRDTGKLWRLSEVDAYGTLNWTRTFEPSGLRYSTRKLSGENGLSGCGALVLKLDARGLAEEVGCLQWSGQAMHDLRGVALTRFKRNAQGFVLDEERFGKTGEAVLDANSVHRVKSERDAQGRTVTELFLGLHGEPVVNTEDGCAGKRYRYGTRGETLEETCLSLTGDIGANRYGITTEAYEVDAAGCTAVQRNLGPHREPVTDSARVHATRYQLNEACQQLRRSCLNLLDQPIACGRHQAAHELFTRDAKGRIIAVRHLTAFGLPGKHEVHEVYEVRYQYDDFGNRVRIACHGDDGAPTDCARTGHHAELQVFDDAGRLKEERFLDTKGAPGTNFGTAVRRYRYDAYDHLIETENFDGDGKRKEVFGSAIQRRIYDERHRLFAVLLLDGQGNPAKYTGCYTGRDCPRGAWHAVRLVRDGLGRVRSNQYFDHQGQPIATLMCSSVRCWRD